MEYRSTASVCPFTLRAKAALWANAIVYGIGVTDNLNRGGHMRTMEHVSIDGKSRNELREFVIPAPSQVAYRQALMLHNDTIWAIGGNRGNPGERFAPEQFATDVWKIDLTKMTAAKVGDLPEGCQSMASVSWGRRGDNLIVGGLGLVDGKVQSRSSAFQIGRAHV